MRRFYGGLLVLVLGSIVLFLVSVAQGPDRDLYFTRELPSSLSADVLAPALNDPARWPEWFHSLEKVETVDGRPIARGSKLILFFNDKKSPWSRMEITAQVLELSPTRLQLAVIADSKKKLDHLFDRLEWDIQVHPSEKGSKILGKAYAHTAHWRSRLFGMITEKILMNQIFYPNVLRLAELKPISARKVPSPDPDRNRGQDPSRNQ